MTGELYATHPVFPTPDIEATAAYYRDVLGFQDVPYLDAAEPHVCLYRDHVEIILTRARPGVRVQPNRELYGYGYDAYVITDDQAGLQQELVAAGATLVRPLARTDYHNAEFVIEDVDGRWLGFGIKDDGGHVPGRRDGQADPSGPSVPGGTRP